MVKINGWAAVYFNKCFFSIVTYSNGVALYPEPSAERHYLHSDVSNSVLGETLRLALTKSKKTDLHECNRLSDSGIFEELNNREREYIIKNYGYKTKKAMRLLDKRTDNCSVSVFDGRIKIQPKHQDSLNGYSGISNDGPEIQHLPVTVSDEELGAALREGFTRCTSIYPR